MSKLLNIATPLHQQTKRDYLARMNDDKVQCMLKAKEYSFDYWDGERRYGYGGYKYDGRQKVIAEALIKEYNLTDGCTILDVGCGKGFLLYELKMLLPHSRLWGFDISECAISNAPPEIRNSLIKHDVRNPFPFPFNFTHSFDLVISLGCLHNLKLPDLADALVQINQIGKHKYVMVEAYRNDQEQFNLQCWALTAETQLSNDTWIWLFNHFGYSGDYEFIYFE